MLKMQRENHKAPYYHHKKLHTSDIGGGAHDEHAYGNGLKIWHAISLNNVLTWLSEIVQTSNVTQIPVSSFSLFLPN